MVLTNCFEGTNPPYLNAQGEIDQHGKKGPTNCVSFHGTPTIMHENCCTWG